MGDEEIDAMDDQPAPDPRPVCRRRVVPTGPPAFVHDPLLAQLVGDRVALPQIHEGMRFPAVGGGIEILNIVEIVAGEQDSIFAHLLAARPPGGYRGRRHPRPHGTAARSSAGGADNGAVGGPGGPHQWWRGAAPPAPGAPAPPPAAYKPPAPRSRNARARRSS